jgi:hypothetical protein
MSGIRFLNSHGSTDLATEQPYFMPANAGLSRLLKITIAVLSIVIVSVVTYLPAVNNSFISDDFTLLSMLKVLDQDPMYITQATSELFRSVTYVYFWICFKLFGGTPELYYWSSIALHSVISILVYLLVRIVTSQPLAGLAAAVFFAAYERHQEAVMWISAANEIILTLNCVLFLILWECGLSGTRFRRTSVALALFVFGLALFSKEAAVALVPLTVVGMILRGYSAREVFRKTWVLVVMVGMFAAFWLSQADRNFFVTQGHYALGFHFFPVYANSSLRLLSQIIPFLIGFLVIRTQSIRTNPSLLFFASLVLLAIVPYSFLTYLNHIPSRNTYFPSVGLAGINGILFAAMYGASRSQRTRTFSVFLLSAVVAANVAYVWLKKDHQYVERAAPTRELIAILNNSEPQSGDRLPISVCQFPLHPWIGSEAIAGFTSFNSKEVLFADTCDPFPTGIALRWDQDRETYTRLH